MNKAHNMQRVYLEIKNSDQISFRDCLFSAVGECSVLYGEIISTVGDTISTVEG